MKPDLRSTLTILALAAFALGAQAQQTTKDGKRIGTRDELRTCFDSADTIAKQQAELQARSDKLTAEAKDVKATGEAVADEVKKVDDDNLTGVRRTRLERKIKEQDARVKALQAEQLAFNTDREAFEKAYAQYGDKCKNVAFDNDDLAAVKQERAAAGKK